MVNVKLAFRTLAKSPFVTVVAVLSLALGIGANVAIFSVFDQMLLQPLPVSEPERLVNLTAPGPNPGSQSCGQAGDCEAVWSYPMFRDLEKNPGPFSGIAAHVLFGGNLAFQGQTSTNTGLLVSGSYFPVLGLRPALGRLLTPMDDQTIGAHFVTVLSYNYWESQLGGNPAVLNQTLVINGESMTIVGVAPRGFEGTTLGARPSVFVPMTMRTRIAHYFKGFEDRRSYWAYLFARLKPGVSIPQARAAINAVYRPIIETVEAPLQDGMSQPTMKRFKAKEVVLDDGSRGQSNMHGEVRVPLLLLVSTTGIVLLIACANIANLLLARAAGRSMEVTVRLALGASRMQILAQLLTESCLLGLLGGVVSLLVAWSTLGLILSLLPASTATTLHFQLHWTAVIFAGALSVFSGLLFGLFPALHSTKPDLLASLSAGSGKHSGARTASRFRASLVTAQIALSMALLSSAGLFIKSLQNISQVDLGIQIDHVSTFFVAPELNGYTPARSSIFFSSLQRELESLPGVTGVATTLVPLLANSSWGNDVSVEGFPKGPDTDAGSRFNEVGPGFFRTLGIPILAGREFTQADAVGSPKVAIVNETFAKKFNLGRDAVGKRMSMGGGHEALDIEIIGLAKDAKYNGVKTERPPLFYRPFLQDSTAGTLNFYVRTAGAPEQVLRSIPAVVKRLDPNLPVDGLRTMPEQVRENVFLDRMIGTLSAAFAGLATILAAVGLYGVLAYSVTQRTKEIGIRMALGADGRQVRGMVLGQVGRMTLVGGAIGIGAALGLGRVARSLLFGLEGHDPLLIGAAAGLLALVGLGAGYVPALRASRIDPMQALRDE